MEFDELFVPPDLGDDYAAGVLTRLFGSIIPRLHGGGDPGVVASNWLETIFIVFNSFCLLMMLVVLSYTIYAMVFDTAADGKTFGQSADTKYTILRTLIGVIGFVPVAGGFSLAQVAFLWVVLQGSALTDVTWRQIADNMLAGTPLVSGTINRIPPDTQGHLQDFGRAFDALVTGHLCGMNANRISSVIAGDTDVTEADVATVGAGPGSIKQVALGPELETTAGFWQSMGGRQVVEMSHVIGFEEADGGVAFSGRDNYCGMVSLGDSYSAREDDGGDLEVGLLASRAQQQFAHLAENVMPGLSEDARAVAQLIYDGERDSEALLAPSRSAIYGAVAGYFSGPAVATNIDSAIVADAHAALSNMVTVEGWMLAPVWQRGVASTVSAIELPGTTLEVRSVRDNRVADFLRGTGYRLRRSDSTIGDMLAKADADQDTWDEMASYVVNLPLPDAPSDVRVAMGDVSGGGLTAAAVNGMYRGILDVFSPVATNVESGNFGFVDPMVQVQRQGQALTLAGATGIGAGLAVGTANRSGIGRAADVIFGTGEIAGTISGAAVSLGTTLLIVGLIMKIVLPLVPLIYFYTTVMSWLLQILETMFAIPLAVLQLFTPAREPTLIGNFSRVLLSVFAVAMRPFFMIVGLMLAMMVIAVSLSFLHELFGRLMFFDSVSGADAAGSLGDVPGVAGIAATAVEGAAGLITMTFFLGVYVLIAFLTVLYGSQIIAEFGDFAMNMIGAAANRYTQPSSIADRTVLAGGLSYAGARSAGQLPGTMRTQALTAAREARQLPGKGGG